MISCAACSDGTMSSSAVTKAAPASRAVGPAFTKTYSVQWTRVALSLVELRRVAVTAVRYKRLDRLLAYPPEGHKAAAQRTGCRARLLVFRFPYARHVGRAYDSRTAQRMVALGAGGWRYWLKRRCRARPVGQSPLDGEDTRKSDGIPPRRIAPRQIAGTSGRAMQAGVARALD